MKTWQGVPIREVETLFDKAHKQIEEIRSHPMPRKTKADLEAIINKQDQEIQAQRQTIARMQVENNHLSIRMARAETQTDRLLEILNNGSKEGSSTRS